MSTLRSTAGLMATSVVVMPIGFLTTVVLARWLTPEDFGSYSVLVGFATLWTLLAQLGWPSATIYRIRRERVSPRRVVTTGLIGMAVTSAIAVVTALGLDEQLAARLLDGAPARLVRFALPLVPAMVYGRFLVGVCRALERFDWENAYRLFVAFGTIAVLSVVLILTDGGLEDAVSSFVSVHVVATLGLGTIVLARTGLEPRWPGRELMASVRYGVKTYAQAIATQLHEQIDLFMLAALLASQGEVGYYAVAVGVVNRLKLVPDAVATVLFPRASSLDLEEAGRFTAAACRHSLVWIGLMMIALGAVAPILVPLVFGAAYAASVPPLLVLLPAMLCMTLATLLSRFFMAFDRQRVTVSVQMGATTANVLLNWILIPRYGVLGAASASLLSYGAAAVAMTWAFRLATGVGIRRMLVIDADDLRTYRTRFALLRARGKP